MKRFTILTVAGAAILFFSVSCASAPALLPPEALPPSAAEPLPPDTAGPELRVTFSPRYFSPDDNRDALAIFLFAVDESPIGTWKIEIHEPQPPYLTFYEWEGNGTPPERLSWNGRSASGELVQSASDYPFIFTASDVYGNTNTVESLIEVDVFVIQDGPLLKIQVPSIVFASDSGGWDGLDEEAIASNDWVLSRIAQVLNKFPDYRVRVEGHANPTVNPSDRAGREWEQAVELRPLSEARARTIVYHLVELGIDYERLSFYGMGGAKPVADWDDRDNWWKNRRVEFILLK